jgi:hypothetical protein
LRELGRGEQRGHALADFLHAPFVHAVRFRDHRGATRHAQQVENVQVLHGLGHDAVVGGDDEEREIDSAHACEHVAYEPLVSRNVDETDQAAAGKRQVREAEIDRNAARFLFRKAVGVHARERFHEQRLAVVDVACGGDDHGSLSFPSWATKPSSSPS